MTNHAASEQFAAEIESFESTLSYIQTSIETLNQERPFEYSNRALNQTNLFPNYSNSANENLYLNFNPSVFLWEKETINLFKPTILCHPYPSLQTFGLKVDTYFLTSSKTLFSGLLVSMISCSVIIEPNDPGNEVGQNTSIKFKKEISLLQTFGKFFLSCFLFNFLLVCFILLICIQKEDKCSRINNLLTKNFFVSDTRTGLSFSPSKPPISPGDLC